MKKVYSAPKIRSNSVEVGVFGCYGGSGGGGTGGGGGNWNPVANSSSGWLFKACCADPWF